MSNIRVLLLHYQLGSEKRSIFLEDEDWVKLLEKLKDYQDPFGILIHSYVLMDDPFTFDSAER